jgi:hypothetical protein
MNYYLLRQAPPNGAIISTAEAMEWDVVKILKSSSSRVVSSILYRDKHMDMFYIHQVEPYAYDMMDAFDIPHAIRKELWVVVPQEVFTPTTWSTISRETSPSRRPTSGVFINTKHIGGLYKGTCSGMQLHERMG